MNLAATLGQIAELNSRQMSKNSIEIASGACAKSQGCLSGDVLIVADCRPSEMQIAKAWAPQTVIGSSFLIIVDTHRCDAFASRSMVSHIARPTPLECNGKAETIADLAVFPVAVRGTLMRRADIGTNERILYS